MPAPPLVGQKRGRHHWLSPAFEWFFALPRGIRRAAVAELHLSAGDAVLDVGCGSGRNFRHLEPVVGPSGRLVGIDVSDALIARAHARILRHNWTNVEIIFGHVLDYAPSARFDAAIFSASYGAMEKRREVLAHVWSHVKPGGRIVVMDARTSPGPVGRLIGGGLRHLSSATTTNDEDLRPWDDLQALGADVHTVPWTFDSYFVTTGVKPLR